MDTTVGQELKHNEELIQEAQAKLDKGLRVVERAYWYARLAQLNHECESLKRQAFGEMLENAGFE